MIFELSVKCKNEKHNFAIVLQLDENKSLLDLHNLIQENAKFDGKQMASFFISDNYWTKGQEITLIKTAPGIFTMEEIPLNKYIAKKGDKLIYVFDFFSERYFKVELLKISKESAKNTKQNCLLNSGIAPQQIIIDQEITDIFDEFSEHEDQYDEEDLLNDDDMFNQDEEGEMENFADSEY